MPTSPPVIVHIPHSSSKIPEEFREQFLLTADEVEHELLSMTDAFTDELYGELPSTSDLKFPVSRLVLDPERFEDDADEPMSERGMGVIYRLTSDQKPLRKTVSTAAREMLLNRFYRPHHRQLESVASQARNEHGRCLILDGHSFPSKPLPYETDASASRPEICIGTDQFHTPQELSAVATKLFQDAGFEVAINEPFSGAIAPSKFYGKEANVQSIMIEVRRDLYMDESTGEKSTQFDQLRGRLRSVLKQLVDLFVHKEI